jgi:hypothetical protein
MAGETRRREEWASASMLSAVWPGSACKKRLPTPLPLTPRLAAIASFFCFLLVLSGLSV